MPAELRVMTTISSFSGSMRNVAADAAPCPKVDSPSPSFLCHVTPIPHSTSWPADSTCFAGSIFAKVSSLKKRHSP